MSNAFIIDVEDLCYQYAKGVTTLDKVSLQVEQGAIYGFLGPNGSGKTTTLSLLLGLLKVPQGRIRIFGQDLDENRHAILGRIGSLIESPSLYGHLTAKENLEVYRSVYGASKERLQKVLEIVGLQDTGSKTVKKFSLGMKQRLAIALALLPKPELMILDEPTNGLVPSGIIELRELIKRLNKWEGMTILISSHILAEVEKMVSHIGIIAKGRMLFQGTLQELPVFLQNGARLQVHTSDNEIALQVLRTYKPEKNGDALTIAYQDIGQVAAIARMLVHNDLDIYQLQPQAQNLEQLFINLTAHQS